MILRLLGTILIVLSLPKLAWAEEQGHLPPLGWYEVEVNGLSVARPAIDAARASLQRQALRLVTSTELKSFLREIDQRRGLAKRAQAELAAGRALLLGMKIGQAAERYRRAVEIWESGFARYYDPGLLAEPVLQLGVALFQAGKKDEARKIFKQAAALVPSLQLSEGYYSPRVREAFAKAQAEMGTQAPAPPTPAEFERLCSAAGLMGMVVVSLERMGDRPLLRLALYDARLRSFRKVETAVVSETDAEDAGRKVAERMLDSVAAVTGISVIASVSIPDGGMDMPDGMAGGTQEDPTPWYRRYWYIWPIAAAVIGTAVALPLTVYRKDVVDVHVF